MRYSTESSKGQKTMRVHPGLRALKGALHSSKGKGLSFAQIREAAAANALRALEFSLER